MSADIELGWEWPADRVAEQKFLIKVNSVNDKNNGFFGIKKSPSLIEGIPDPVLVKASIVSDNSSMNNKTVEVTVPKLELDGIVGSSYAVIGVVDSKICICIKKVESATTDISTIACP